MLNVDQIGSKSTSCKNRPRSRGINYNVTDKQEPDTGQSWPGQTGPESELTSVSGAVTVYRGYLRAVAVLVVSCGEK